MLHPVFATNQGWTLEATDTLIRQGHRLYSQLTGLPWVPTGYTLSGPDGTRYTLDAAGQVTTVKFADGAQWLVSDAGVVASAPTTTTTLGRVDFIRDDKGRISRVTGVSDSQAETSTTVYRYDAQNRLILARALDTADFGTPYAYDAANQPLVETVTGGITANLGAAVNWTSSQGIQGRWRGLLQSGQGSTLAFAVRDSELASGLKAPGAQAAVIIAIESQFADAQATLQVTGATVLGTTSANGVQTTLVRITEAGVKLIRLSGTGTAQIRVSIAGDSNRDGVVDGADTATTTAERQILFTNYGFKANTAPTAASSLPVSLTHTDLATTVALGTVAQDLEGDQVFWRVLGATHGTARFNGDGQSVLFTPELGFVGQASITVQADDGFAASSPIELTVNVSGAKLLAIRITNLAALSSLKAGQSIRITAEGDFADEAGVRLTGVGLGGGYLTVHAEDLAAWGVASTAAQNAITVNDASDTVRGNVQGAAAITVRRVHTDGTGESTTVRQITAFNVAVAQQIRAQAAIDSGATDENAIDDSADEGDSHEGESFSVTPDVYPLTLTLTPGGLRQLKVQRTSSDTGEQTSIQTAIQQTAITGLDLAGNITTVNTTTSATRYLSSDESIASVDANGLITAHKAGHVTISVLHLAAIIESQAIAQLDANGDPVLDADGNVVYKQINLLALDGERLHASVIGQTDIRLSMAAAQVTDTDDATVAPRAITVAAATGGAVTSTTGETVLVGAGALVLDTAISIERMDINQISAITGLSLPDTAVLQSVGSFRLDMGAQSAAYPLQMVVTLQGDTGSYSAGEEVLFFRKGQVYKPDGQLHDTWWLVDNGFIGQDANGSLVARTASPPYGGLNSSGEYLVMRRIPGLIGGVFDLGIGGGGWVEFGNFALGGGLSGVNISSEVIGILMTSASTVSAGSYHFGQPQFADIPLIQRQSNELNVSKLLPPVQTPYGTIASPNMAGAYFDEPGQQLTFYRSSNSTYTLNDKLVLRAILGDGSTKDVISKPWDNLALRVTLNELADKGLGNVAIGSLRFQIVHEVDTRQLTTSGNFSNSDPIEIAGNTVSITPTPDMAAVLTRSGVQFVRQNKVVGEVALLDRIGTNNLANQYLTGEKIQPAVFSTDLSRAYIAGNGKIYAIDLISFKLIETIAIPDGRNITSIVVSGDYLIFGEGEKFGSGSGGYRLMAIDANPASKNYHKNPVTLKIAGLNGYPYGVAGMAMGPDGKTLVVSMPKARVSYSLAPTGERGDVLVLDLSTLNVKTGAIAAPVKADLPAGNALKAPQTIKAPNDKDRFLVSSPNDYNRGLSTLTLTRDAQGKVTSAKLQSIEMNQPGNDVRTDRLNIQRAQSAVLVEKDGVQYAIVADDNYNFLDPYWKAMFEAPDFVQLTPFGPPTPIGGSASAKKVAVGGKLGIVKDPFGKQGQPQFMGATLPLDGYGIINLSLSKDGKVLIGQLKGGFSANIFDMQQKAHQSHAWNVEQLIAATLAHPEDKRLQKHIKLPNEAEQYITVPTNAAGYTAAPAGTMFNNSPLNVQYTGNMGDVIKVDLAELAAIKLLTEELNVAATALSKAQIDARKLLLKGFSLPIGVLEQFRLNAQRSGDPTASRLLIATQGAVGSLVPLIDTDAKAFLETGVLYLLPNITNSRLPAASILDARDAQANRFSDIEKLRMGQTLADKFLSFGYGFTDTKYEKTKPGFERSGQATVTARDYATAPATYFGDRPLANPGYSNMTLAAEVKKDSKNMLDVLKVEQRLKYLGYSSFEKTRDNKVKEFKVDGKFETPEATALRGFYAATHYTQWAYGGGGAGYEATDPNGKAAAAKEANRVIRTEDTTNNDNFNWLNAYNAPHWVDMYAALPVPFPTLNQASNKFSNGAGNKEAFGISWVYDLMQRWRLVQTQFDGKTAEQKALLLTSGDIKVNGLTSPSGYSAKGQHETGGHSTGMALDLGFATNYITVDQTLNKKENGQTPPVMTGANGWSYANAVAWSGLITDVKNRGEKNALRNFLSLYSLTVSDGDATNSNGTWEEWQLVNGDEAKRALFGDGTQAQSMIQHAFVGDAPKKGETAANYNSFPLMRAVVQKLEIPVGPSNDHEHHFHVDFRTPARKALTGTSNLFTESMGIQDKSPAFSIDSIAETPASIAEARADFEEQIGELDMLIMDAAPSPQAPYVWVAHATKNSDKPKQRVIGACTVTNIVESEKYDTGAVIDPAIDAVWYFESFEKIKLKDSEYPKTPQDVKLIRAPQHGRIGTKEGDTTLRYFAKAGFTGVDKYEFEVMVLGQPVRVIEYMNVVKNYQDTITYQQFCEKRPYWRIAESGQPDTSSTDHTTWLRSANLSALIASAQQSFIGFTDLLSTALGQTTGEGTSAQITLDTNAAGHNWYIDPTPLNNTDDFLPSSNPNLWQAKAGSDAAGKMDMLSVLLHEYGHALGLEHSADSGDFMATTLQPGERRLPSSAELTLMSQLVAQLKASTGLADGSTRTDPTSPTVPNPSLPLGALLMGRLALGRKPEDAEQGSQALFSANATLQGGNLSTLQDWAAQGTVVASAGNGNPATGPTTGATLSESASAQTRLNQVFMVGPQDRYLSFTLSGIALDDAVTGPDDALEVALLDANSGASLVGPISMTHTDALLNLQANGAALAASGVNHVTNQDGSRTYLVDLTGVAAAAGTGRAVNLSFDLIGFGSTAPNLGSHATVSQVRLLAQKPVPQTLDDSTTTAEDTVAHIIALANDLDTNQVGINPAVVTGPLHERMPRETIGSSWSARAARLAKWPWPRWPGWRWITT